VNFPRRDIHRGMMDRGMIDRGMIDRGLLDRGLASRPRPLDYSTKKSTWRGLHRRKQKTTPARYRATQSESPGSRRRGQALENRD
jgi:hypothetical protein